jgi:triacylglycerol lipase
MRISFILLLSITPLSSFLPLPRLKRSVIPLIRLKQINSSQLPLTSLEPIFSRKLTTGIENLSFGKKSLLFAELSRIAYSNKEDATKDAIDLGFTNVTFYDSNGSQSFKFMNEYDIVILCRGTEKAFSDIKTDIECYPIFLRKERYRVHYGFNQYVNDIWKTISTDISKKENFEKNLWFTGHSLGAAMSTIMAKRCSENDKLIEPKEIYTYGSPRVGWYGFVKKCNVTHYRWKNDNDIVTGFPSQLLGYQHHGIECYIDSSGTYIKKPSSSGLFLDRLQGIKSSFIKIQIDQIEEHNIDIYIKHLKKMVGSEINQV